MPSSVFLRDYVAEMGRHTDAPDVYHYATAFAVVSALMTRHRYRVRLASGEPAKWMNAWTILVGDSGIARKSTAIAMGHQIAKILDPGLTAPKDSSAEGFLNHLKQRDSESKGNACTLLYASELSHILAQFNRSYSQALKPLLMELYDTEGDYKRSLAQRQIVINTPRVSMLGGIATELLPVMSDSSDWHGGFFNRSLIVVAQKSKEMDRARSVEEETYETLAKRLKAAFKAMRVAHLRKQRPRVDYDKKASKLANDFCRKQLTHPDPDVRIVMSRAPIHLMRVAYVEAFDADPTTLEIDAPAVERAMRSLLLHWAKTLPDIVMECCARGKREFEGDRLPKRILRFLQRQDGKEATWSAAMRGCALASKPFRDAITSLAEAKLIEVEEQDDGQVIRLLGEGR